MGTNEGAGAMSDACTIAMQLCDAVCYDNREELARLLGLFRGPDAVAISCGLRGTAMHVAIREGRLNAFVLLHRKNPAALGAWDWAGRSPLPALLNHARTAPDVSMRRLAILEHVAEENPAALNAPMGAPGMPFPLIVAMNNRLWEAAKIIVEACPDSVPLGIAELVAALNRGDLLCMDIVRLLLCKASKGQLDAVGAAVEQHDTGLDAIKQQHRVREIMKRLGKKAPHEVMHET